MPQENSLPLHASAASGRLAVREALRQTARHLEADAQLTESARLDAHQLIEIATGLTRVQMLAAPERPLSETESALLDRLLVQRLRHVPIQYLRGSQEFYGRSFFVTPDVLIPRPETESIIEEVLRISPDRASPLRIVDIGTGSGILAITLALEFAAAHITALDISPAALAIAQRNAQALGADPGRLLFMQSDLLSAVGDEQYDIIVSNPPYVPLTEAPTLHPQVLDHEPHLALFGGTDGHDVLRRLIPQAWLALRPGGCLLLETAGRTATLESLLAGWSNVAYRRDLQDVDRIVLARRPVG